MLLARAKMTKGPELKNTDKTAPRSSLGLFCLCSFTSAGVLCLDAGSQIHSHLIRLLTEMLTQVISLSGFLPGAGRGARVVRMTVTKGTSVFLHSIRYNSGCNSGDYASNIMVGFGWY